MNMKKTALAGVCAAAMTISMGLTAFGGQWRSDANAGGTKTRMEAIQQTPGSGSTETVMEQPNVTSSTARDTV